MTAVVATMPVPLSTGAKKKKRLSFGWGLKNSDQPQPIALLAENDDEAEKRQRRKSLARRGSFIDEESSSEAIANVNNNNTNRRASMRLSETPIPLRKGKALSSAQITDLYARCIQLSAENKINRANSWGLNLIDYIDDVMQTHNQDGDLTNFQAASCTLEASTKIYSCRVDSVHEDTFKILGGLNRTAEGAEGGVAKDGDEDGEGGKSEEAKKKVARRHGVNTLEGNPDNLDVKKFDLEFDVDPLFRKTSAAFDEGGARGLLLNHLSVGYGGDIVFDSIDAVNLPPSSSATTETLCDLSDFQDLLDKVRSAVRDSEICPSFSNFHFSKVARLPNVKKTDNGDEAPMLPDFGDQDDDDDLLDGGFDAIQQEEEMMEQIRDSASLEEGGENGETLEVRETALRRNKEQRVVVSAANGIRNKQMFPDVEYCLAMADAEEVSVDMTKLLQNWAGPEHWKFTSAAKDKQSSTSVAISGEGEAKKPKQKKKAFFIDFFGPEVDSEKAFAPPGKASTTLSSANLEKATAAATTLPPDIHYDLSELTRLFLKPNWAIRLPSAWRQSRDNNNPNNSEFIAGVTEETNFIQMSDDYDDDEGGGGPFGQDDDERHPAFAAGGDCFEGADLVAQPKKVEQISINYAKVAKKVDVKSLKSNIWSELSDLTTISEEGEKSEQRSFTEVLDALPRSVPEKALEDISVPFCFICLLHLANEKGLTLTQSNMSELYITKSN